MSLPIVLVTHQLPDHWLTAFAGQVEVIKGVEDATALSAELETKLPAAEGLLSMLTIPVNAALLARAPRLRVIGNMAVGYDNVDVAACTARRIPVGNTPDVLTEATADLAFALLLAAARRLPEASRDAIQGRWQTWRATGWLGADLNGATLGIVGLGKIGQAVAQRAISFGMHVVYTNPSPRPAAEETLRVRQVSLEGLLRHSDFVSLHCPLTPQTRRLINREMLRLMKPGAVLINTARGGVVDTSALTDALRGGWIRAAALDVTDPEPLPATHPLYQLENCLITPHIGSATENTRRRMAEISCQNILAGLAGRRLPHCINPEVYE